MNRTLAQTLFAASLALAFSACGGGFEASEDLLKPSGKGGGGKKTQTVTTFTARTTDWHQGGVEPVWKSVFPIDTTYDVYLAAEIGGTFSGHHTATFELRMPDGSAYQQFEVPFATDAVAYEGEQQAESWSGGWRVWARLPVAGTMIQTGAMAGSWTLNIYVDGASTPTATASFLME